MIPLQCIVADDEPIARQILENYIAEVPNLELAASCKNAFEVMAFLQKQSVDVLFLDINMPKLSGISLLKTMQQKPTVIITTAYPEYAVQGFELSVTDYLLKPFSLERFLQAVLKIEKKSVPSQQLIVSDEKPSSTSIFVKSDKKIIKLDFDNINHIEAFGNYIKIYAPKMILVHQTLADFFKKLPDNFLRIHKSFVINFDQLSLIDGNLIILKNEVRLPIGKSYRKAVLEKIDNI